MMFLFSRRRVVTLLLVGLVAFAFGSGSIWAASQEPVCFPQTNQCIDPHFRNFYSQGGHAGLPVFGMPITVAQGERNADTGQLYLTQWFERNRFESHPENKPPYDILLGRLGNDRLRQLGRTWQSEPQAAGPKDGCLWFPQTRHNVCDYDSSVQGAQAGFKSYWQTEGILISGLDGYARSLALHGYPLTEPRMETNSSGDTVLTQWFERDRFEWHATNPPGFRVQLGLLGSEQRSLAATAQLAFIRGGNVMLLNVTTGDTQQLTTDGANNHPVWSRDGKQLAFTGGDGQIWAMDADGAGRTRVTTSSLTKALPAWSPDQSIYFIQYRDDGASGRIEIVRRAPDGTERVEWSEPRNGCRATDLRLSLGLGWALSQSCGDLYQVFIGKVGSPQTENLAVKYPLGDGCAYDGAWAHRQDARLAILTSNHCRPSASGTISLADVTSPDPPREPAFVSNEIGSVDWSSDDQQLVFDMTGSIYLVQTGGLLPPQHLTTGGEPAWRPN